MSASVIMAVVVCVTVPCQTVYDLYGVVNHHGMLGAGHYTAYCKNTTTRRYCVLLWPSRCLIACESVACCGTRYSLMWYPSQTVCVCMCLARRWHCFNDRIVSDVDEVTVQSANAYLLFYVRRDLAGKDVREMYPRTGAEPVDITKLSGKTETPSGNRCAVM